MNEGDSPPLLNLSSLALNYNVLNLLSLAQLKINLLLEILPIKDRSWGRGRAMYG